MKPIPFSTPMTHRVRAGLKTQTRRVINPQPTAPTRDLWDTAERLAEIGCIQWREAGKVCVGPPEGMIAVNPYGRPGDLLWVREEHYRYGHWAPVAGVLTKTGRQKWRFVADSDEVRYEDNPPERFRKGRRAEDASTPAWYKRLARFMPRSASRLTLEITDVRVDRVQSISEEDAEAEGIACVDPESDTSYCWIRGPGFEYEGHFARDVFRQLWNHINAERGHSWESNPFVWVIGFKIHEEGQADGRK